MKHVAIYLPGLNDQRTAKIHAVLLKAWGIFGVKVVYLPMNWSDKKSFATKFNNILSVVDNYASSGQKVSLVGVSAGASAAINTFAARKDQINKVVCICGMLNNAQTINKGVLSTNPAFGESMKMLGESLEELDKEYRDAILSLRPLADPIVSPDNTVIKGAHNSLLRTKGHGISITYAVTIGSQRICNFIKHE